MYYYKILTLEGQLLGVASSNDLRYYNPKAKRIFCCQDGSLAQYIYYNQQIYRPEWFKKECDEVKGKYPKVQCQIIPYEEFQEIRNSQNSI